MHLFENNLTLRPKSTALKLNFLILISMYLNFSLVLHWLYSWEVMWCLMYIFCKISWRLWLFVSNISVFFCLFSVFHRILYLCMGRILENFKCLKFSWLSYINLSNFTYFTFSKTHTIMKVDVLPFLNVSSTLGLPIVCKLEEWKRLAQLLVGKPTLAKLHMIQA